MSKIEWTHRPGTKSEVLNPTTGCDKVSQGCKNCYAEVMHKRLRGMGQQKYQQPFLGHVKYWRTELAKPFKWKKPRTVFLNSMSDIFHKDISIKQIAEIYAMMFLTPQHTYIVLTKRADRAAEVLHSKDFWFYFVDAVNNLPYGNNPCWFESGLRQKWPLRNVWQGVSVENQEQADERIPHLLTTPSYIRVLSCEPLLGPISIYRSIRKWQNQATINNPRYWDGTFNFWTIVGGESGHNARPMHPDWARSLRDQSKKSGSAYFFKQWGTWWPAKKGRLYREKTINFTDGQDMVKVGKKESGNFLDGVQHLEFPA